MKNATTNTPAEALDVPPPPGNIRRSPGWFSNMRKRFVAGLLLALPFLITIWIVYWLYTTLDLYVIGPAARLVVRLAAGRAAEAPLPPWFADYIAPLLGAVLVLAILYLLGFFAQSRADALLDAILYRVPVITSIHKAVRRMFAALQGQGELSRFQRVVLVSFPHPGMRVPGFVTSTCRDELTGRTILCVYVPTTPVPTSGYMLLVPEDEVTELAWNLEETIQAVVSFGITAPSVVRYFPAELNVNENVQARPRSLE